MPWEATGGRWQGSDGTRFRFHRALGLLQEERVKWEKEDETLITSNPLIPKVPTWTDGTYDVTTKREDSMVKRSEMGVRSMFHLIGGLFGTSKTTMLHPSRGAMYPASHVTGSCVAQKHDVLTF